MRIPCVSSLSCVLLLFASLFHGNALHAQCSADGPDLNATSQYILDHTDSVKLEWDIDEGKLYNYGDQTYRNSISFMSLNCNDVRISQTSDGGLAVFPYCRGSITCVHTQYQNYDPYSQETTWRDQVPNSDHLRTYDTFGIENADPDAAANVKRSVQHFIFLLQQAYRAQHNDPSDPFAPPHAER